MGAVTGAVGGAPPGEIAKSPFNALGWLAGAPGAGTGPAPVKGTASVPTGSVRTSGGVFRTLGVAPPEGTLRGFSVPAYYGSYVGPHPPSPVLPDIGPRAGRGEDVPVAWSR